MRWRDKVVASGLLATILGGGVQCLLTPQNSTRNHKSLSQPTVYTAQELHSSNPLPLEKILPPLPAHEVPEQQAELHQVEEEIVYELLDLHDHPLAYRQRMYADCKRFSNYNPEALLYYRVGNGNDHMIALAHNDGMQCDARTISEDAWSVLDAIIYEYAESELDTRQMDHSYIRSLWNELGELHDIRCTTIYPPRIASFH